ncbi:hypothetical protein ACHAXT_002459 [Thalassiosira profunda]
MLRLATALAVLLASAAPSALAFSPAIRTHRKPAALKYHPTSFDRAVDCVSTFGKCDIDELLELSEELENFQGCFYEGGPEACAKEIDVRDRKDLADALLLQGELIERNRYIKDGNLFAYDVKADKDMHERDEFFDRIAPALDM